MSWGFDSLRGHGDRGDCRLVAPGCDPGWSVRTSRVQLPSITLRPRTGEEQHAPAAQRTGQRCPTPTVAGSTPAGGTSHQVWPRSSVVEHPPVERKVAGSIPVEVALYPASEVLFGSTPGFHPGGAGSIPVTRSRKAVPPFAGGGGFWACGVTGSAPPLHGEECRFESDQVHARVAQSGGSKSLIQTRSKVQILPRALDPGWSAGRPARF